MNYQISWKQNYNTWFNYPEKMLELQVELSAFKEANAVIAYIKSL